MKEFIVYLFQTSVCLSTFWIIYELFLNKETFFSFSRMYLIAGMILSLLLPFCRYSYDVPLFLQSDHFLITENATIEYLSSSPESNIWLILTIFYLCGILFFCSIHVWSILSLRRLIKKGNNSLEKEYRLIDNPDVTHPFSTLNYIFINTLNLPQTEKEIILQHEVQHIRQRHWIDLMFCRVFMIFQWFNPILHRYITCIKNNHEYLTDKAVLESGTSVTTYTEVLINQTFQYPVYTFQNSFNYSLSKRLSMMSKKKSSPRKKVSVLLLLPFFGLFIWACATPNYVAPEQGSMRFTTKDSMVTVEMGEMKGTATAIILNNLNPNKGDTLTAISKGSKVLITYEDLAIEAEEITIYPAKKTAQEF